MTCARSDAPRAEPADTINNHAKGAVHAADNGVPTEALPKDASRMDMMRRVKHMSVEERVTLFERLSRDGAWIRRSARRIR
jgi:hypothetical protein